MRALITGINGAAGSYLAEHLRETGVEVSGITRSDCDLMDFPKVLARLKDVQPDVIYHLAADANVREAFDKPADVFSNNTIGTINIFESVRRLSHMPTVMVASSSEVYGNPKEFPITETMPFRPSNPYAVSKAAKDLLGQMYGRDYGIKVVITRGFSYVNPRRHDIALSNFARQIVAVERGLQDEILHGNLDSIRAWCDVRDVVKAFALTPSLPIIAKGNDRDGIYNIGGTETFSIGECLFMLKGMAKVPIKTREDPALIRIADVTNQIPDCTRFMDASSWKPQIAIEDSLTWLLDYYRAL